MPQSPVPPPPSPPPWMPQDSGIRPPLSLLERAQNLGRDVIGGGQSLLSNIIGPNYLSGNLHNPYSQDPAERGQAYNDMANAGMGLFGTIVSHGTPFDPEAFSKGIDLSNVRKGTGGLAQGHGWYVGENPAVPLDYKKRFEEQNSTWKLYHAETGATIPHPEGNYPLLEELATAHQGHKSAMHNYLVHDINNIHDALAMYPNIPDPNSAVQQAQRAALLKDLQTKTQLQQLLAKPEVEVGMVPGKAHILTADIPDEHVANMLDWDKPIAQQPGILAKLMGKLPPRTAQWLGNVTQGRFLDPSVLTGKNFYEQLADEMKEKSPAWTRKGGDLTGSRIEAETYGKKAASDLLAASGIPGNKYMDRFSRLKKPEWQLVVDGKPVLQPDSQKVLQHAMGETAFPGATTKRDMIQSSFWRGYDPKAANNLVGHLANPKSQIVDLSGRTRNYVVFDPSIVNEIQHNGTPIYRKPGIPASTPHSSYHWTGQK